LRCRCLVVSGSRKWIECHICSYSAMARRHQGQLYCRQQMPSPAHQVSCLQWSRPIVQVASRVVVLQRHIWVGSDPIPQQNIIEAFHASPLGGIRVLQFPTSASRDCLPGLASRLLCFSLLTLVPPVSKQNRIGPSTPAFSSRYQYLLWLGRVFQWILWKACRLREARIAYWLLWIGSPSTTISFHLTTLSLLWLWPRPS